MGRVYGIQGRAWAKPDGGFIDQLQKIVDNLSKGIDDRAEILSFYNPGEFHMGCLRPCMHTHNFSILDGTLYLTSFQRSCDVPLLLPYTTNAQYELMAA
jgi:thymidylate synthase